MIDFGIVKPGTTLYIPFATYAGSTGASVTMTGLAVTDVEIFKDGGTTQRASDTGYALLDTDGIDFDGITGIHGFSIDLSSNATAGFFTAGSQFWVVVSAVTVDSQTVNFLAATFRLGYPAALLNTTIATLATQTSFTLTAGPAEDDVLNGCLVVIHDIASAVQWGKALVADYTGSTRTVTLVAGVTFTAAAGDNISVFLPANQPTVWGRTLDVSAGGEAGVDWANVGSPTTTVGLTGTTLGLIDNAITAAKIATDAIAAAKIATGAITAAKFAAGAIDAAAIATDAIASAELAASAVNKIRDALLADSTPFNGASIAAILADTNELQTDDTPAALAAIDAKIDIIDTNVDDVETRTTLALPASAPGATGGLATFDNLFAVTNSGTVDDATPAVDSFNLSSNFSATDDFHTGEFLVVEYASGLRQARLISNYIGATRTAEFNGTGTALDRPFTTAPANGDAVWTLGAGVVS